MKIRRLWDPALIPFALGPVVALLAYAETALDPFFGGAAGATWISTVVLGGGIVLARWYPLTGAVVAAACFPVAVLAWDAPGPGGAALIGLIGVVGWVGWREPARRSVVALVAGALVLAVSSMAVGETAWELFFVPMILVPGWFMGLLARRNGERARRLAEMAAALDAQREAAAQAAVAQERTRIAREVHDAVAHSVSVMTLQLGGLRKRLADRPADQEIVLGLERLGRQSVEEMRGLVGILRERVSGEAPAPAPSLRRVDELVVDVRAAGLPVTCEVSADLSALPPVLDVTAYRVLQEALMNVLRHAGEAPTSVVIGQAGPAITLEVVNGPPPASHRPVPGSATGGHGLVGMRERLTMVNGTLRTGPEPDGGFAVRARFPLPRTW